RLVFGGELRATTMEHAQPLSGLSASINLMTSFGKCGYALTRQCFASTLDSPNKPQDTWSIAARFLYKKKTGLVERVQFSVPRVPSQRPNTDSANQTVTLKRPSRSTSSTPSLGRKPRRCTIGAKRSSRRVSTRAPGRNWTRRSRSIETMAAALHGLIVSKWTGGARSRLLERRHPKPDLPALLQP